MIRKKSLTMAACFTILGLLMASCAPAATGPTAAPAAAPAKATTALAAPSPTARPAAEQPKYGGTLKLFSFADPGGLDPHQETSVSVSALIMPSYNSLLQYSPLQSDKIIGDLAEKWEVSPDGAVYTFHLYKGIKFHNGKPATAQDAKFSLDRVRQPPKGTRSPRSGVLQSVTKMETPDENTLVVTLAQPAASFISNIALAWMAVVPLDVVGGKGDLSKDVLGTGPFRFKSYSTGVAYEVVKFADYFIKGRPYLDGITFYIIKDATTSLSAFRTGHIMRTLAGAWAVKASQAELLKKEMGDKIQVQSTPTYNFWTVQVNFKETPWGNPKVRAAANLALDRPTAIKVLEEGEGEIGGPMPALGVWALPKEELLKMPGYRADKSAEIAEAKKLLADAGFAGGLKTAIKCPTGPNCGGAVFIKDQFAKIGIDASVQVLDKAVHDKDMAEKRFATNVQRLGAGIDDPDQIFGERYITTAGRNYAGLSDPRIDELYAKQSRTLDVAERKKLVVEMERLAIEANANMVLFWARERVAVHLKVKGWVLSPSLHDNNKYQDVWLAG
ncbi:MAG: hypothetical protein HYX92_17775 [Chloroflexi bacterium]|nr:hypothetical protein [Chloroflexota bacterium]